MEIVRLSDWQQLETARPQLVALDGLAAVFEEVSSLTTRKPQYEPLTLRGRQQSSRFDSCKTSYDMRQKSANTQRQRVTLPIYQGIFLARPSND